MKHVLKALNKELQSLYDEQKTDKSIINKLRSERAKLETEVCHLKSEKHTLMLHIEDLTKNK
jgi:peptidoglycan hydrolase CwlO-like protein